jgi:hypothetical protein
MLGKFHGVRPDLGRAPKMGQQFMFGVEKRMLGSLEVRKHYVGQLTITEVIGGSGVELNLLEEDPCVLKVYNCHVPQVEHNVAKRSLLSQPFINRPTDDLRIKFMATLDV